MRFRALLRRRSHPEFGSRLAPPISILAACTAMIAASFSAGSQAEDAKVRDAVKRVEATIARGPYQANWSSLQTYQVPAWYLDAKF